MVVTAYVTAIAVYGLDVMLGYTGQLSLAHAGFFGIGGYTVAILTTAHGLSFWIALPIALALTCVLGHLIGLAALRTRHDYFAIFTLAVGVDDRDPHPAHGEPHRGDRRADRNPTAERASGRSASSR